MIAAANGWSDRRRALLVAVSAYDDPGLQTLSAPPGDAARLRDVLTNPGRGGFAAADITVVHDPDLHELQRALGGFVADAGPDELLTVYFSGHALRDGDGEVFLACRDTIPSQPWTSAMPGRLLRGLLDSAAARRQIVILDCCHAAGIAPDDAGNADAMVAALDGPPGAHRVILAASGVDQEAFERHQAPPRNDHSLFTDALIDGIDGGAADLDGDGLVSMADAFGWVRGRLHQLTGGRQTPALAVSPPGAEEMPIARVPGAPGGSPAHAGAVIPVDGSSRHDEVSVRELDAPLQVLAAPIIRLRQALNATLPVAPGGREAWLLDGVVAMLGARFAFIATGSGDS